MENKENTINKVDKVTETLTKELEGLSEEGLHEFFMFFLQDESSAWEYDCRG